MVTRLEAKKAFKQWEKLNDNSKKNQKWAKVTYPPIDFQDIYYYAAPKSMTEAPKSLDDVDPEMIATFDKLGIPISERGRETSWSSCRCCF